MPQYKIVFNHLSKVGWLYEFAENSLTDAAEHVRWMFPEYDSITMRDVNGTQYIVTPTEVKKIAKKRGRPQKSE